jgi:cellulose synthase/poly-beta-1,6-N-acetylglucosamine synthase-like glycosyltransferase
MIILLFWIALFGCLYSYALYPAILLLLPARRARPGSAPVAGSSPRVSLVIACRNEAARLPHKLENALQIDYENLEVIVASDASDDDSDSVVRSYADRGVRLVRSPERRGKEYVQGLAVAAAEGEIVVFSDAGTDLTLDSIGWIVSAFADSSVGAVSSEDHYLSSDGKIVGEGAYVRYEMWLRRLESGRAGLVGLSGSFFAVRRSLLGKWDPTIPSDFACALRAVLAGTRAVSEPRVRGIYREIKDPRKEYGRKLRTVVRGMTAVARLSEVLNPMRFGMFAFQVWGHKIMRWLVPWFMLLLFLTSVALRDHGVIYALALALQVLGYGIVLLAHWVGALRAMVPVRVIYFFVQANLALAHAGIQFLIGRRIVTWEPSTR